MVREVGMKTMRLSKQNALACMHARHTNARAHAVVAATYIACKWRVVSKDYCGWVITVFMQHSIKTLLLYVREENAINLVCALRTLLLLLGFVCVNRLIYDIIYGPNGHRQNGNALIV